VLQYDFGKIGRRGDEPGAPTLAFDRIEGIREFFLIGRHDAVG
jgi:hypothetical protein